MHSLREHVAAARRPEGAYGRQVLDVMNAPDGAHAALATWAFSQIRLPLCADALDLGCGGGANLLRLLALCPQGHVTGLDFSPVSVATSREIASEAIAAGSCTVVLGDVEALPFPDVSFDFACAFETIYFWPDALGAMREAYRVLRPAATFLICNEVDGEGPAKPWESALADLHIYTEKDLRDLLIRAGFSHVHALHHHHNAWLSVIAHV